MSSLKLCVEVEGMTFHEDVGLLRDSLGHSPATHLLQVTSNSPFCVEIDSILGGGRVESVDFRPNTVKHKACRGFLRVPEATQALRWRL